LIALSLINSNSTQWSNKLPSRKAIRFSRMLHKRSERGKMRCPD